MQQLEFDNNRAVTEFMRDHGLDDKETRKEFAQLARCGYWRRWSDENNVGYSVTFDFDSEKFVVRFSEGN